MGLSRAAANGQSVGSRVNRVSQTVVSQGLTRDKFLASLSFPERYRDPVQHSGVFVSIKRKHGYIIQHNILRKCIKMLVFFPTCDFSVQYILWLYSRESFKCSYFNSDVYSHRHFRLTMVRLTGGWDSSNAASVSHHLLQGGRTIVGRIVIRVPVSHTINVRVHHRLGWNPFCCHCVCPTP